MARKTRDIPCPAPGRLLALVADQLGAAWLDDQRGGGWRGPRLALTPTLELFALADGTWWRRAAGQAAQPISADQARQLLRAPAADEHDTWVGFQAYEHHDWHRRVPTHGDPRRSLLRAWWARHAVTLLLDPAGATATLVAEADALDRVSRDLAQAADVPDPPATTVTPHADPVQFETYVRRAKAYIADGDIYQVNLAQTWSGPWPGPTGGLYGRCRSANPGRFGAYLCVPDVADPARTALAILCTSPELFLRIEGRAVVSQPIKGTRARGGGAGPDDAARQALADSPKEQAELAMITDLIRNDLGRCARLGSVTVEQAREIEAHAAVLHAHSTIRAELADGLDAWSLLASATPGGSITGCPKLRAMQIIAELERAPRGVYCGCVGWLGPGGGELNIAIRTVTVEGGRAYVSAGAGIVADSDPAAEQQETVDKVAPLLAVLGGGPPRRPPAGR